jgi:hypothetical protein
MDEFSEKNPTSMAMMVIAWKIKFKVEEDPVMPAKVSDTEDMVSTVAIAFRSRMI